MNVQVSGTIHHSMRLHYYEKSHASDSTASVNTYCLIKQLLELCQLWISFLLFGIHY